MTSRGFSPILAAAALAALVSAGPAQAGYVTVAELANLKTGMDAVFAQAGFGANTVEVRFNTIQTIVGPTVMNSDDNYTTLEGLSPDASPTVDAFFVDSIAFCGEAGEDFVGCANRPGHELWLDSAYVDTNQNGDGATDFAHELGHNLSLIHLAGTNTNLMNPVLGSTVLTAGQITAILASALIQTDNQTNQKYIAITPIQVVPVPPAVALFASALAALGFRRRQVSQT